MSAAIHGRESSSPQHWGSKDRTYRKLIDQTGPLGTSPNVDRVGDDVVEQLAWESALGGRGLENDVEVEAAHSVYNLHVSPGLRALRYFPQLPIHHTHLPRDFRNSTERRPPLLYMNE